MLIYELKSKQMQQSRLRFSATWDAIPIYVQVPAHSIN